jgi:hypothetical protein
MFFITNLPSFRRLFLLASFIFFLTFSVAFAQDSAGVGLKPATIEEMMESGEERDFSVEISNLSGSDQTYYLSRRDITGVNPGGVPIFAQDNIEKTGYELSEWITLGNQSASINFRLKVPENAAPGSHFGGVFVSIDPPRLRSTGASVSYEVANIISIRVAGDAVESAQIRQFSTDKYFYSSKNVDFLVRIENEGNVLVRPSGPIEINNMFGKREATLTFNESLAGVFPKTTRDFTPQNWTGEGSGFGRYEALISVVYGDAGSRRTISSTVTFWILPMNIIGPAAIILAVVLLSVYFGVRMYIRRTVAMASAGSTRRLVRTRRQSEFPFLLVFISMLAITALFLIILLLLFA